MGSVVPHEASDLRVLNACVGGLTLQLLLENEVLRPNTEIDELLLRGVQCTDGSRGVGALVELLNTGRSSRTRQRRRATRSNTTRIDAR